MVRNKTPGSARRLQNQVIDKYLKSRKGRVLSLDEINHVSAIADSLAFTIEQMARAAGLKAFSLLAPALESIAILRAKIIEQRASEARDVTAQMQTNLEASGKREAPKIEQTLELLRSRFNDIKKPKAT
jgi:hypothetical protein